MNRAAVFDRIMFGVLLLALASAAAVVGGCTANANSFQVPLAGAEAVGASALRVEVENARGRVIVEEWEGVDYPRVAAVAHTDADGPHAPVTWDGEGGSVVVATLDASSGTPTLRVRGEPAGAQQVDLLIRAPRIHGVSIHNAGGTVDVVHASGPVFVRNSSAGLGAPAKHLAAVRVRTDDDLTEGLTLVTDRGEVTAVVGVGSAGRMDLRTADGDARWTAEHARVTEASVVQGHYVGTLNGGSAPITLRTDFGEARLHVLPEAGDLVLERHTARWERWDRERTFPEW